MKHKTQKDLQHEEYQRKMLDIAVELLNDTTAGKIIKVIIEYSDQINELKNNNDYRNIVLRLGDIDIIESQKGIRDDIAISIKRIISEGE
jgi:hypothetical protein